MTQHLHGKVCMVTGATAGIGLETARALASQGATLIIVGRNQAKTQATVDTLHRETGAQVNYLLADLSSQADIRQLVDAFERSYDRLDVLVNNAGAYFAKRQESPDGIELTWALNHLNYFMLTGLLLDVLRFTGSAAAPARIVNVSSDAHRGSVINFDDVQGVQEYSGWRAYAQSKLANIMFTYALARRLGAAPVTANTLHPGVVASNFAANNGLLGTVARKVMDVFSISPREGAATSVYLASSPEVRTVSGNYFVKCRPVASSQRSYDHAAQERLWSLSETLIGMSMQV